MKKLLLIFCVLLFISLASAIEEKNVKVEMYVSVEVGEEFMPQYGVAIDVPKNIVIHSIVYEKTTKEKTYLFSQSNSKYFANVNLFRTGEKIFSGSFPLFESEEDIKNKTAFISFIVPYMNADTIEIVYNNEVKYIIKLDKKTCNSDGLCKSNEDYFSCFSDCHAGNVDDVCVLNLTDGICDPDCGSYDIDCTPLQLCNNKLIDEQEQFIDCGAVCNNNCVYNDASLDLLVKGYDQGRFHIINTASYIAQNFKYAFFFN